MRQKHACLINRLQKDCLSGEVKVCTGKLHLIDVLDSAGMNGRLLKRGTCAVDTRFRGCRPRSSVEDKDDATVNNKGKK